MFRRYRSLLLPLVPRQLWKTRRLYGSGRRVNKIDELFPIFLKIGVYAGGSCISFPFILHSVLRAVRSDGISFPFDVIVSFPVSTPLALIWPIFWILYGAFVFYDSTSPDHK